MESKAKDLKALQITYWTMLIAVVFFAGVALFLFSIGFRFDKGKTFNSTFFFITVALAFSTTGMSYWVFRKRLEEAKNQVEFSSRFEGWRAACFLQMAMSEGPSLFGIIIFLITSRLVFLLIVGILILRFLSIFPSKRKMIQQLELNSLEAELFE